MRYRDENSQDMLEFLRTHTVKWMMEVSMAMKPSVGILYLNHRLNDVAFISFFWETIQ